MCDYIDEAAFRNSLAALKDRKSNGGVIELPRKKILYRGERSRLNEGALAGYKYFSSFEEYARRYSSEGDHADNPYRRALLPEVTGILYTVTLDQMCRVVELDSDSQYWNFWNHDKTKYDPFEFERMHLLRILREVWGNSVVGCCTPVDNSKMYPTDEIWLYLEQVAYSILTKEVVCDASA